MKIIKKFTIESYFLLVLLLTLLLVISGCEKENITSQPENKLPEIETVSEQQLTEFIEICKKIESQNIKDSCFSNIAELSADISYCENISSDNFGLERKDNCLIDVVRATKDPEICKKTSITSKSSCYMLVAIETKNSSYCNKMKFHKSFCILQVAVSTKNADICEEIDNTDSKASCIQQIARKTKNIELCNSIDEEQGTYGKGACLGAVAEETLDLSLCDSIAAEDTWTKDYCYYQLSYNVSELGMCDKITDDFSGKSDCYARVAVDLHNEDMCLKARDPSYCISNIAANKKDVLLCNNFEDGSTEKDVCVLLVAEETGDKDLCEQINARYQKNLCYSEVAQEIPDIELCNMITDGERRNECYRGVAYNLENKEFCKKILLTEEKDVCLKFVSDKTHNIDICEEIQTISEKDSCYFNYVSSFVEV